MVILVAWCLQVVATDLSPAMVGFCRQKGLDAHVMDFLHLDFPAGSFDAVYALNCLLHVPNADLPECWRRSARCCARANSTSSR